MPGTIVVTTSPRAGFKSMQNAAEIANIAEQNKYTDTNPSITMAPRYLFIFHYSLSFTRAVRKRQDLTLSDPVTLNIGSVSVGENRRSR
jgi:hypothetical protein